MKGTYKVKKEHLKLLHREARIIASQFDSFTINHHRNTDRMSNDPFSRAMPTLVGVVVKDDLESSDIVIVL